MKKELQFGIWYIGRNLLALGGTLIVFFVLNWIMGGSEFLTQFLQLLAGLVAFLLPAAWYLEAKHVAFSINCTRKKFFVVGQLQKVPAVLLSVVAAAISPQSSPMVLCSAFASAFAAAALSELFGILTVNYGKKGFVIFSVVCGLVGALLGAAAILVDLNTLLYTVQMFLQSGMPILVGIAVGLGATAIGWGIFQRQDV